MPFFTALLSNRAVTKSSQQTGKCYTNGKKGFLLAAMFFKEDCLSSTVNSLVISDLLLVGTASLQHLLFRYNNSNIPVLSTHEPTSFPLLWSMVLFLPSLMLLSEFLFIPLCLLYLGDILPQQMLQSCPWENHSRVILLSFPKEELPAGWGLILHCPAALYVSSESSEPVQCRAICGPDCLTSEQHLLIFLRHWIPHTPNSRVSFLPPTWPILLSKEK